MLKHTLHLESTTPLRSLVVNVWKSHKSPRRRVFALVGVYCQFWNKLRKLQARSRRNGSYLLYVGAFGLFGSKKDVLLFLAQRADLSDAAFFTFLRDFEFVLDMRLNELRKARQV